MICIGIDSSLACTAIAVLTRDGAGKPKLLYFMKILTTADDLYIDRCGKILDQIMLTIDKYSKENDDFLVGIETPNSFRNGTVTRMLCGLYGMILYTVKSKYGINMHEINTKHAKKVSTGDGGADKKKTIKAINRKFGLQLVFSKTKEKSDDDVADAISIAYCMLTEESSRRKESKKKIEKVIKPKKKRSKS